ncbi:MAG: hypothetical protein Q8T09_09715 [Candidatus Melainabacteria bacterium]|nr:hypothetical protein [Candidatus Melainabacteria bacterium]
MKTTVRNRRKQKHGSSLIETVVGCIFIVTIALFLLDVASIVICQTQNDALAKHCARAASNYENYALALPAVNDVVNQFVASGGGSKICQYQGKDLQYPNGAAQVLVVTRVTCNFPVPIPFGPSSMVFSAEATEPVVADVVAPIP